MTHSTLDGLPERPKINPTFVTHAIDENTVHLRAGPFTGPMHRFHDGDEEDVLAEFLEQLDGTNTVEDILAAFDERLHDDLLAVLTTLDDDGVLLDATNLTNPADVTGYLSLSSSKPVLSLDRLDEQSVVVLGTDRMTRFVVDDLLESGIGRVFVHSLDDDDPEFGSEAVKVIPAVDVPDRVRTVEHGVYLTDQPHHPIVDEFNLAAIEAGTPFTVGQVRGFDGLVGPTVFPDETACFECYRRRRNTTIDRPESYRDATPLADASVTLPSHKRTVAGQVATEVVKYLAGAVGFSGGRIVHHDFFDLSVEANDVIRLPRCPACSRSKSELDKVRHASNETLLGKLKVDTDGRRD